MSSNTTRSRRKVSICSRNWRLAAMASLNFCSALSSRFSKIRICFCTALALSNDAVTPPFFAMSPRREKICWLVDVSSLSSSVSLRSSSVSLAISTSLCLLSFWMVSAPILLSACDPEDCRLSFSSAFILRFSRVSFSMLARCFRMWPCASSLVFRFWFSIMRNWRCSSAISCSTGLASSSFFFLNVIMAGCLQARARPNTPAPTVGALCANRVTWADKAGAEMA
mmetsp:Transcript_62834/g.175655  ORF Transcript_62834/g.175655 Transcript_62834/m.175655 type:complete len:225 (-) Transcript_62834:3-677(-)